MSRPTYTLFESLLKLAHHYWSLLSLEGGVVVDATCGNGHDSLRLAKLALDKGEGKLYCIDIQKKAIENTASLLKNHLCEKAFSKVFFIEGSHAVFPDYIPPCDLITYNLGYLPGGGEKQLTTLTASTLQSIQAALSLIKDGGLVSIMCYPGHREGEEEEKTLLAFCETLPSLQFFVCYHRLLNRKKSPTLILINKKLK